MKYGQVTGQAVGRRGVVGGASRRLATIMRATNAAGNARKNKKNLTNSKISLSTAKSSEKRSVVCIIDSTLVNIWFIHSEYRISSRKKMTLALFYRTC